MFEGLRRAEKRHWAPLYPEVLQRSGQRKSITRLAEWVVAGELQHLHHFVSLSFLGSLPVSAEVLLQLANHVVGDPHLVLTIQRHPGDDTGRSLFGPGPAVLPEVE